MKNPYVKCIVILLIFFGELMGAEKKASLKLDAFHDRWLQEVEDAGLQVVDLEEDGVKFGPLLQDVPKVMELKSTRNFGKYDTKIVSQFLLSKFKKKEGAYVVYIEILNRINKLKVLWKGDYASYVEAVIDAGVIRGLWNRN